VILSFSKYAFNENTFRISNNRDMHFCTFDVIFDFT